MCEVSEKVNKLPHDSKSYKQARLELYRGQTNCPYWHGVFGGFYLPHLRSTAYSSLIKAENITRKATKQECPLVETEDFDQDGFPEVQALQ